MSRAPKTSAPQTKAAPKKSTTATERATPKRDATTSSSARARAAKAPEVPYERVRRDLELSHQLGRIIVAARGEMSQGDLARATGLDQSAISRIERGARPTLLTLLEMQLIESACNRPPGWILRELDYLPRTMTVHQALNGESRIPGPARVAIAGAIDAAIAYGETLGGE